MNTEELEFAQKLRNKLLDCFTTLSEMDTFIDRLKGLAPNDHSKLKLDMMNVQSEFADMQELLIEMSNADTKVSPEVESLIEGISKKSN